MRLSPVSDSSCTRDLWETEKQGGITQLCRVQFPSQAMPGSQCIRTGDFTRGYCTCQGKRTSLSLSRPLTLLSCRLRFCSLLSMSICTRTKGEVGGPGGLVTVVEPAFSGPRDSMDM